MLHVMQLLHFNLQLGWAATSQQAGHAQQLNTNHATSYCFCGTLTLVMIQGTCIVLSTAAKNTCDVLQPKRVMANIMYWELL